MFFGARTGASRHQAREELRVAIAAGKPRDRALAAHVDLPGEQGRQPYRPARLDHELELAKRERHRAADLGVARRDAGADERAVDLEGDAAGRLRHQGVADRAADRVVLLALAARERARVVVEAG